MLAERFAIENDLDISEVLNIFRWVDMCEDRV